MHPRTPDAVIPPMGVIPVSAQPKTGTHKRLIVQVVRGGEAATFPQASTLMGPGLSPAAKTGMTRLAHEKPRRSPAGVRVVCGSGSP